MREILVFCSAKITFMETAISVKKDMWCFPGCAADVNCDWLHRQRRVDSMNVCLVRRSKHWQNKKHLLHPESANPIVSPIPAGFFNLMTCHRSVVRLLYPASRLFGSMSRSSYVPWVAERCWASHGMAVESAMLGSELVVSTFLVMWELRGDYCQARFI